jgi:hypothetical protein
MSEIFDSTAREPAAESSRKASSAFAIRAKEKLLTQVKQEPVKTLLIVLAGSILTSFLLGYCISRMEEESRRQRLVEGWMEEMTNWMRERGRMIAAPIKGGVEATRSAVEEVSRSGARARAHLHSYFQKQKRTFLNFF